jgi:SAM-dependent methyltransferase
MLIKSLMNCLSTVELGRLDRVEPVSTQFGFDRGKPIDRYYIENFLIQNTKDIRGRVLEVGDSTYTKRFGGDKVEQSDILHAIEGNSSATIVADLTRADNIPINTFDCIILTQTLQFVYDLSAAVNHLHRILKPNGVLLITVPGISQISRYDMDRWGDFWRFTTLSVQHLFNEKFSHENIEVKTYGNVLAATAFLYGLAVEDLKSEQLDYHDPDYQMLITVRAVKSRIK